MDQEDKLGIENPPEVSSNPLSLENDSIMDFENLRELSSCFPSLEKDDMAFIENPPGVSCDPPSLGKDDKMGTDNPLEVSCNPPALGKDNRMGIENPLASSTFPTSSRKDDVMGTENPPAPPTSGKDDIMGTENSPELSSYPPSSGKDDMVGIENPPDLSVNLPSFEKDDMIDIKNPPEASSNPPSSGKDDNKKDSDPPEGSSKPELSSKDTPQSLKAKPKIVKKSLAGKLKAKKNNGSLLIRGKKINRKNKKVANNAESCQNADEKQNAGDNQLKKTDDGPPEEKNQEDEKTEVKESGNGGTNDQSPLEKSHQAQRNKDKMILLDKAEQKQKNKRKRRESNKGSRSRKNKDKQSGIDKSQSKGKKSEKLGGLIFMCNAKTKPDCFRYRVMGVSAGKKDDVLRVKPGLKLFLFDFDLKLLYGIYKASSSGGMKLEPRAFRGKFPAQVRFNIASDCFPLPENVFKKAIKDNYDEKNKFRTELTVRQVRKLTRLFRPVGIHSTGQPIHSPPRTIIRERKASDVARGSRHHSFKDRAAGDRYTSYNDRDHRYDQREEITHDLFLDEKNYRAYGLQGNRRYVATASRINPVLEPYERDYERHRPDPSYEGDYERRRPDPSYEGDYERRHLDPSYRRNVPARLDSLRTVPLSLIDSGHRDSFHGAVPDHIQDPYYAYRHGASPRDVYLTTPLSREEIPSSSYLVGGRQSIETDNLLRRDAVHDRLYSVYSHADALSDYNQMRPYHGDKLEASPMPVSHRYTFAGPSFSRR